MKCGKMIIILKDEVIKYSVYAIKELATACCGSTG